MLFRMFQYSDICFQKGYPCYNDTENVFANIVRETDSNPTGIGWTEIMR